MFKFTDRATMDAPRKTANGYLVGEVRCARTGCQQYRASEVGMVGDGVVTVYRPEDAVFDKASLATYAGKPVTLNHPPVMVDAANWKTYAVGDVGSEIVRDGEFVRVPYKIMDAAAITSIEAGAREVSMGYTSGIEYRDGIAPDGTPYQAVQTGPIQINHLAIVPKARGGSELRIGDAADQWGASPVTIADMKGADMPDALRKIMVDGLQVETTDAAAVAIEKLQGQIAALKDAEIEAKAKAKADMDAKEKELAEKDAKLAEMEKGKMTDAAIDARVAARADLISKASAIAKDVATVGLSDAAIRKSVVVAKLGDDAVAGKSDAYIDARFDILAEGIKDADPVSQVKDAAPVKLVSLDAVYSERNADLANAWKAKKGA
ncbi:MAG: DUF2213 domain-containing protein [Cypionkella sp.]|nr:DUF2213 domain-containing protein [Cypionkella sp.]